jgi:hypothetical protein
MSAGAEAVPQDNFTHSEDGLYVDEDTTWNINNLPGPMSRASLALTRNNILQNPPRANSQRGEGLTPLSAGQIDYCRWIYNYLGTQSPTRLHPKNITSANGREFAEHMHGLLTAHRAGNTLDGEEVIANLNHHYELFPPPKQLSPSNNKRSESEEAIGREQSDFDKEMFRIATRYLPISPELQAVSAARRIFYDYKHWGAVDAASRLAVAYGMLLKFLR